MKFNLFNAIKNLEIHNQRNYLRTEIAAGIGVSRPTLNKMLSGDYGRTTLDTVLDVLNWFESESMPIGVDKLLTIERVQTDDPNPNTPNPATNH